MSGALPRVAFQGELGAFSEEALLEHFGGRADPLPRRDFRSVGEAVMEGEADFGVLPVENTLAGSVQGSQDVLLTGGFTVVGEIVTFIRHCLLGVPGADEGGVRRVLSHPVALAQCTRYFSSRPDAEAVAVYDTAGAAREVARLGDPAVAAIAARGAAERYGLEVLASDLQDRKDNQTRFFVVRRNGEVAAGGSGPGEPGSDPPEAGASGVDASRVGASEADAHTPHRTVVLLELDHRPGSLLRVLEPFASRGINLSRLESRPGRTPWRYRFLLELESPADDPELPRAVAEARRGASILRVLGSFPAAVIGAR